MRPSLVSGRQIRLNHRLNLSKLVIKSKTLIERNWRSWLDDFAQVISLGSNLTIERPLNHKRQIIYPMTKISHKCPNRRSC